MKGCRPYTPDELRAHEDAFCGRNRLRNLAFFMLGVRSGFRVSELLSLKIGDVYFNGHIQDRVSVARRHMKGKHESRSVFLHPSVKPYLMDWLCELSRRGHVLATDWLFVRDDGLTHVSRKQMWRIIKDAAKRMGLNGKIGTHSMRKTFADRVYGYSGNDIFRLQKAMGHKDPKSTSQYLSFKEEDIDTMITEAFDE